MGHRRSSSTKQASRPATASDHTTRRPSQPFSAEDLELALQKSHLEATTEESDKSSGTTPFDEYDEPSPFLRPRGGSIYVPYDGQGTPPKLPFWGNAYPDDENASLFIRRESIFLSPEESESCTPQYERRQSVFAPSEGCDPARRASIFVPTEAAPCECPPQKENEIKRKPQPCCPSDAIAAILARKDPTF